MLELGLALKPLKAALNLGLYCLLLAILRTAFVHVAKAFSANLFFGFNNPIFQTAFFLRYLKSSPVGPMTHLRDFLDANGATVGGVCDTGRMLSAFFLFYHLRAEVSLVFLL